MLCLGLLQDAFVAAHLYDGALSPDLCNGKSERRMVDEESTVNCCSCSSGDKRINGYNRVIDSSECKNGYAYVTQRFIEPPYWHRTVWDVIQFDLDAYAGSFARLVVKAGLTDMLMDRDADYTVMVPTNDALAPIIDSQDPFPYQSWEDLVLNHIIPTVQATKFMERGSRVSMITAYNTEVDMIKPAREGSVYLTCANKYVDSKAKITDKENLLAANGVVHMINAILYPDH